MLFCIQNRLCTEKDVKAPNWYFSATHSNRIILTGEGISEIKQEVEQYISSQKLIYTFDFVESKVVTKPMSGTITVHGEDNSQVATGVCELLVKSDEQQRSLGSVFAVSCAHLLMDSTEVADLDTGRLTSEEQENILRRIQGRTTRGHLTGRELQIELGGAPLLAYVTHQTAGQPMNDMALFKIQNGKEEQLENRLSTRSCCFNGILDVRTEDIQRMVGRLLYSRRRRGDGARHLVSHPMRNSFDERYPIGSHISYVVEKG